MVRSARCSVLILSILLLTNVSVMAGRYQKRTENEYSLKKANGAGCLHFVDADANVQPGSSTATAQVKAWAYWEVGKPRDQASQAFASATAHVDVIIEWVPEKEDDEPQPGEYWYELDYRYEWYASAPALQNGWYFKVGAHGEEKEQSWPPGLPHSCSTKIYGIQRWHSFKGNVRLPIVATAIGEARRFPMSSAWSALSLAKVSAMDKESVGEVRTAR